MHDKNWNKHGAIELVIAPAFGELSVTERLALDTARALLAPLAGIQSQQSSRASIATQQKDRLFPVKVKPEEVASHLRMSLGVQTAVFSSHCWKTKMNETWWNWKKEVAPTATEVKPGN